MLLPVKKISREKVFLFIAFTIILLYVLPLYILNENAHIRVHDNLDSNIAWYKVLAESGQLLGGVKAVIPQIINGLPRDAYGTEWSGIVWLHALFPSMTAYAVSQTVTRVFAFIGMYVLLKAHVIRDEKAYLIRIGVSLAFALTPFWPSGMLSTLGHPLALWAFLNIRARNFSWKEWITLALLPLYSSFVLGFFFFLAAVSMLWLYDLIVKRDWNLPFLGSIALMTGVFLAIEYRLVYSVFASGETMHRVEFISSRHDILHSFRLSFKNFVLGHNHVMTVHTAVILPVVLLTFMIVIGRQKQRRPKEEKLFIFLMILNYALSLWYAFWFNKLWALPKEKISFLSAFNFARFHFLRPLVIYVSFAVACYILWRIGKRWRRFVYAALLAQLIVLIPFQEELTYGAYYKAPTFREFYASEQFKEIKQFIRRPERSYRVASIGLHPAIAQYNGFYTLDTYANIYPLKYKYQFRKIIAKELEKNAVLKRYFDEWGSRCYLFVDELGKHYAFKKNSKKKITNLELNTEAFKEMGGRYIFSSVPIMNARQNKLTFLKRFSHSQSAWNIYLYEAK
ncbi:DUF6044 family protein [Bacillus swezeyi]|uniref:YkoS n=1 Tax=Bacillus swezeyi TaxID=1925020 RepID=A0A1R1S2V5_9BACI|nr:DUF6044 family protein [Bacillus swezeyi]MEC1261951.1 DUF6044 family protein [Bacillus swezeyi]MED2930340.1 DUF6044 family protein [Bacillus swezeyi]MED2966251.1 DUF6044 family protein [Bacillus swezeyi]MED2976757.1 DUF6044 family protein [Bacillus swezeyi]MED3072715.1 DUF6044 family protein [Bacillus swezeyi]